MDLKVEDDPLWELADAVARGEASEPLPDSSTWDIEDREAAKVLFGLARLSAVLRATEPFLATADSQTSRSSCGLKDSIQTEPSELPYQFGAYQLIGRLGSGGFGQVFRAIDPLDREVAIKVLKNPDSSHQSQRQRLIEEGQLAARARHPSLATVYGIEEEGGCIGLAMELIEGQSLNQHLEDRGCLGGHEVAAIGIDICGALAALHSCHVIHGDVKPQNVVRSDGRVVLVDLGIGFDLENPGHWPLSGTPLYVAPELLRGEAPTPQSDIYSLGVLLYFALSGQFPIQVNNHVELVAAHEEGPKLLRDAQPNAPMQLAALIDRCLDSDPARRPKSAGEVERHLLSFMTSNRLRWRTTTLKVLLAVVLTALLSTWIWVGIRIDQASTPLAVAEALSIDNAKLQILLLNESAGQSNQEGLKWMASVSQGLREAGAEIVSLERMRNLSVLMRRDPHSPIDRNSALHMCSREGRIGLVAVSANSKSVQLIALDCATGQTISMMNWNGTPSELSDYESSVVGRVVEALRSNTSTYRAKLPDVTTASIDALRFYAESLPRGAAAKPENACDLIEAALDKDPKFATAYLGLAECRSAKGDLAGALEASRRAFDLRSSVSEPERLRIEGVHYGALLDYEPARNAARRLTSLYPQESLGFRLLAQREYRMGRPHEALEAAVTAAKLAPSPVNEASVIEYQIATGQAKSALTRCSDSSRLSFGDHIDWLCGRAALAAKDTATAAETFGRLTSGLGFHRDAGFHWAAQTALLLHRLDEASRILFEANQGRSPTAYWIRHNARVAFRIAMIRQDFKAARRALDDLIGLPAFPSFVRDHRALVEAAAELGIHDPTVFKIGDQGVATLERIVAIYPSDFSQAATLKARADLEIARGQLDQAEHSLAAASVLWDDLDRVVVELRLREAQNQEDKKFEGEIQALKTWLRNRYYLFVRDGDLSGWKRLQSTL